MSQRAVESVLGRLLTDVDFRAQFFAGAAPSCARGELALTDRERDALLRLNLPALADLARYLDPTIVRGASLSESARSAKQTSSAFRRTASAPRRAPLRMREGQS